MTDLIKNFTYGTLSADIAAGATSLTLSPSFNLPTTADVTASNFFMTIDDPGSQEIVKVTAVVGSTLTIVRAQEGTTSSAHTAGVVVKHALTKGIFDRLRTVTSVTDYGAVGNGVRLFGAVASANSTAVQVAGGSFTQADQGKAAIVYNDSGGGVATTIASVTDGQNIVLAANAGVTTTSANGYIIYGTDDTAAIQAALNAAAAKVASANSTNPNQPIGSGHATVIAPGVGPDSLYVITSALTIPGGVQADFTGTVANLLASRNAPCVLVQPFSIVKRLEVEAAFGTGVDCGTNGAQAHIVLDDIRVWHCAGNSTAPSGLTATPSTTGGTLSANTRYYVVTAIDAQAGETLVSNEVSAVTTGTTSSVALAWTAVAGAVSYRIYRGTGSGQQNLYFTSATNSFTDTGGASTSDYPIGPGTGLLLRGYHYEARHLWVKVARLGIYHRAGSDCVVNAAYAVGCVTAVRMNASNQVKYSTLLLDTCGGTGSLGGVVLDNGCTNIKVNAQAFQVSGVATALTPVVNIGPLTSTVKQVFCDIEVNAARTGGTVLSLANAQDCRFKVLAVNTAYASSGGGAITTAIAYGSGLVANIDVSLHATSGITTSSGTQVGTVTTGGGVQSTTGFGLPTTTGRTSGDLHYDANTLREYVISGGAWVSTSGALNTVGAGLPALANRVTGDHHFNLTDGRDYIKTGTAGAGPFTDSFSRSLTATGKPVVGTAVESGGATWQAWSNVSNGSTLNDNIGGQWYSNDTGDHGGYLTAAVGAQEMQLDITAQTNGSYASLHLNATPGAPGSNGAGAGYSIYMDTNGGPVKLRRDGVQVAVSSGNVGGPGTWRVTTDGATKPTFNVYKNGTLVASYTETGTALNGTALGVVFGQGSTGAVLGIDNFVASATGSQAWTPGAPGTVGFGLPTTVGRVNGDLHFDTNAMREYTLVAGVWSSTSGAVNTVSAGLPSFTSRVLGDHHFNTTTLKDYVLTGVAGARFTDSFSGTDGALTTTETGGLTYTAASGGMPTRTSGYVSDVTSTQNEATVNIGAGQQEISADVIAPTVSTSEIHLHLRATSNGSSGYDISIESGRIKIGRGAFIGSSLLVQLTGAPSSGRYLATVTAGTTSVVVSVSRDGTPLLSYTDSTPETGTYVGFGAKGAAGNTSRLDNVSALSAGTLAWSLGQTNIELVNTVAASGAATTLPDVDTATQHVVTLTANCTFTFASPAVGKSFTLQAIQDATGGRTATWPAAVVWPNGVAPTLTTTAAKEDVFTFMGIPGNKWLGLVAAQNV